MFSITFRSQAAIIAQLSGRCKYNFVAKALMATQQAAKWNVYVTRLVPQKGIESLSEECNISQWTSDNPVPRDELLKNVADVDALFCLLTDKIDKAVLDAAGSKLKVIGTMSVGYDHIDIEECKRRKISVGYTPNVLTDATAELTIALLLATSRRIPEGIRAVKSGEWGTWKPMWLCGQALKGSTVGIVGLGRIGQAVARRLIPFGVHKIIYSGSKPKSTDFDAQFVSFDSLLQQSDFIVVTCAMTPDTAGLFNSRAFSQMKSNAMLINTSRGGVVNQNDLYEALKSHKIAAAGLDVTTPEPLPVDHPLLTLDNCVVLPHIASATDETRSLMSEMTARNILAALHGQPLPAQLC